MSLLETIERGALPRPPRLLVYGTEGVGKSTFAAAAPRPVFVQTEDGLGGIACDRFPLARSYDDVLTALTELRDGDHGYETVVLDSADWLERLVVERVCRDAGARSLDKVDGGYGRGQAHALRHWADVVALLDQLRDRRGMVVLLLAHARVERFEDPEGPAYDRYAPRLHRQAAALLCEWCDAVLFATRRLRTHSEPAGFGRTRTTAHAVGAAGGERVLRPVGGPSCVAKNRFGLAEDLPLSWPALVAALSRNLNGESNG